MSLLCLSTTSRWATWGDSGDSGGGGDGGGGDGGGGDGGHGRKGCMGSAAKLLIFENLAVSPRERYYACSIGTQYFG